MTSSLVRAIDNSSIGFTLNVISMACVVSKSKERQGSVIQLYEGYVKAPAVLRSTISYPMMFEHLGKSEADAGKE